jgi:hypothetical protein
VAILQLKHFERNKTMKRLATLLGAALITASVAFAHAPRPGPNGGLMVDAGQMHAELLVDGSETVKLYLFDVEDKPVDAAGHKVNAILIVDGKPVRFAFEPAEANLMTGKAPGPVAPGVKGALQIIAPDGSTAQAKY